MVSPATSTFVASPNALTADGVTTTALTATIRDSGSNPVTGRTITLSSNGTSDTFSPQSGTTDGSGMFTATMKSTKAQQKTVTASVAGTGITTSVTFTAGSPNATMSSVSASPTAPVTNGTSASKLTFTVRDAFGNPVTGQAVTLAATGTGNTQSSTGGATDGNGNFIATLTSTVAEPKTVTATAGSVSKVTTVTFVAGPPNSSKSSVQANPTSLTADGVSTSSLTVTVKDAQNNPVPSQSVNLADNGSGYTFSPVSGATNTAGVFVASLSSSVAQPQTVTATFGAANANTVVTFVPGAANSGRSSLVASPSSVTANGSAVANLTVTVKDAQGNLIGGQAVTFSTTGVSNTLTPTSCTSNASGNCTATLSSPVAESKTVTAAFGGANANATVVFVPGPASSATSSLVASPNSLTADGSTITQLTVTARDANGNLINGQVVNMGSTGTANNFSPSSGTTNASGVFNATLSSTSAQSKNVRATMGSANANTTVVFVAGSPNSVMSSFSANPTSVTTDGGVTATLTVTLKDTFGNLVSGQAVSFASDGNNNTLAPASGSTVNGVVTATLASTTAQVKSITATVGSYFFKTASVTFTPGAPSNALSKLTASPTSVTANGASSSTLTLAVKDAGGNAVPGANATFGSNGSGNAFNPVSGTTNSVGVLTSAMASTVAQVKLVTGTRGAAAPTANVTFVAGAAAKYVLSGLAGGAAAVTSSLTVLVQDAQGNTAKAYLGKATFTSSDAQATRPTTYTFTSSDQGVHVFTNGVVLKTAGTQSVTATDTASSSISGSQSVTITAGAVSKFGFAGVPSSVSATAILSPYLAAVDAYNNIVQSYRGTVTFSSKCWGNNPNGSLGYGDTLARGVAGGQMGASLPAVPLGSRKAVDVDMGGDTFNGVPDFTCALFDTGYVTCWGANTTGQLGLGDTLQRTSPANANVNLGTGRTASSLSAGSNHACVILDNGQVECWGGNSVGQLGIGSTVSYASPVATVNLGASRYATAISTGSGFTCVVLDTTQVLCWGSNTYGQLGIGTTVTHTAPVST